MQRRRWSFNEIEMLGKLYPQQGAESVALAVGRSRDSVTSCAKRFGQTALNRRTRQAHTRSIEAASVNARFFDELTPETAYVLGFLSGGGVRLGKRKVLRISVDDNRKAHLVRVLDLMKSQHQIQRLGWKLVAEVCNSHIVNCLMDQYHWPPCRRHPDPPMPEMPRELVPHFAKGHFHRNGWGSALNFSMRGTPNMSRQLAQRLQQILGVSEHKCFSTRPLHWIGWTNTQDVEKLIEFVLQDEIPI